MESVSAGSDAHGGNYKCNCCGYRLESQTGFMPPCPSCVKGSWELVVVDPYTARRDSRAYAR